ncbi:sulfotransferase [Pseudomonas sp. TE50-2]|uniref:sulfotransferase family protein n=1 Tax=Pseudomonas sp. TE50-2 TaxID=3142707 RepID=UPI0034679B95
MTCFFITGSGRSGTTSLLRALGLSSKVVVGLEPEPTLNIESRDLFDGRLKSPYSALAESVVPRLAKVLDQGQIYVEKHLSLIPFVPYLHEMLDCKFIIPIRDGRDVVTSMVSWHNQMFPIIYQECTDTPELSDRAKQILANQVGMDTFDYSLPRPSEDDPWYEAWPRFTRFEMVAWYWSYVNEYLFDELKKLPPDRFMLVDYSNVTADVIKEAYTFMELPDYDEQAVSELLNRHVNSLNDRVGENGLFPKWQSWDPTLLQRFWDIAGKTMIRLGFAEEQIRPMPVGYGQYAGRAPSSATARMFNSWYEAFESGLSSVVEVDAESIARGAAGFSGKSHVLVRGRGAGQGAQVSADIIRDKLPIVGDLVVSRSGISHAYDIDAFVRGLASLSGQFVYIGGMRGHFRKMKDHRHIWHPSLLAHDNDVSVSRVCEILREEGFETIVAAPVLAGADELSTETVIISCRNSMVPERLLTGHELCLSYAPYQVTRAFSSMDDIVGLVNTGCAYFSDGGLGLANPLSYFKTMLADLRGLPQRYIGSMRDLLRPESTFNTAIRVDVDMDLVAGLEMSRVAAAAGLPLTFYILHTAPYYGYFYSGIFYRHECSAEVYRAMQANGCEIGLHIDALGLYIDHEVDGAQAVVEELAWLRQQQIHIYGTTAHNCAPVYGAENFEIFKGHSVREEGYYLRGDKFVPLEVLDCAELGLEYEGSQGARAKHFVNPAANDYLVKLAEGDFLRDAQWFKSYIMSNGYNDWGEGYKIWLLGKNMWVIAGNTLDGAEVYEFNVTWERVREFLATLTEKERVIFTLHPIYLGARKAPGEFPIAVEC